MDAIKKLEELADQDTCDGDCDLNPPYRKCSECEARRALNEISEVAREAIRVIEENYNGRNR